MGFFRGINVGGHNKVPMAGLRQALSTAGFAEVATLIQSGNVVFASDLDDGAAAAEIRQVVADGFDVDTPVIIRSRDQVAAALNAHPWPPGEFEAKFHQIAFLADSPPSDGVERLIVRALNEDIAVIGDELHVRYREGQARSKFTIDWIGRQLATVATGRNLATVEKVLDLLDS